MDVARTSQLRAPQLVSVDELRPWDENPRTITAERLENLRRAIAADPDFLRLRPILARSDGLVYCGNQRYLAAVANGATAVPAILEDIDERTMRERAIRDNEQWGEWSDGLGLVLRSLQGAGSDLGLLGLGNDHIERLLAAVLRDEATPEEADLTPPETATTQPGQLYELGPHRLVCGDSRDPEVWARLLGEEQGDLLHEHAEAAAAVARVLREGAFPDQLQDRRERPGERRRAQLAPRRAGHGEEDLSPGPDRWVRPEELLTPFLLEALRVRPVQEPHGSESIVLSGRASTRGNQKTAVQIDGKDVYVGVNAYVYAEPKAR